LFIEAPLKTGFSVYTGGDTYEPGDENTAEEVYTALKAFFTNNPEYSSSKVLIAGEGLAGQYIPVIA